MLRATRSIHSRALTLLSLVGAFAALSTPARAVPTSTPPQIHAASGGSPITIAEGDLDGDGIDPASASETRSRRVTLLP
jgi:hypothetical protein